MLNDFRPEAYFDWASKSTNIIAKSVFFLLALFSCNIDDQLSQNFHRFVIVCIIIGYTPSETLVFAVTKNIQCL